GFGKPNVYHATVVIFLEFFAWGLLTSPMLTVRQLKLHSQSSKGCLPNIDISKVPIAM
ncbi:Hippocampus abundant transcript-like protein 2, partial [Exaiptasia diaphana]